MPILIIFVNLVSLRFMCTLQLATGIVSAVSSEIARYLSSITWNLPLVAFFFAYFKPGQSLNGHDILFLTCCPAHLREEVKQEHEREHVSYHVVSSDGMMVPDHDKAFVSVWGGIKRPDNPGDMEDFYLRLVLQYHSNVSREILEQKVFLYSKQSSTKYRLGTKYSLQTKYKTPIEKKNTIFLFVLQGTHQLACLLIIQGDFLMCYCKQSHKCIL